VDSTWSGADLQHSRRCHLFSLPPVVLVTAEVEQVKEAELVSPELVAVAAVAAQLVVEEVEAEQALVVEAQVLPLSPALLLQRPERHQAQPRLCSLRQCRPL
jgi:hypothetical protein